MLAIQDRRSGQSNRPAAPVALQQRFCDSGCRASRVGICQLPDFYVRDHLRDGTLVEPLSDERHSDQAIWAVFPVEIAAAV
jgi:DNA-binding transcriptional LysR family regulator